MAEKLLTSRSQAIIMVDFMERNGDLSRPQMGSEGRARNDRLWSELANTLNSDKSGSTRSYDRWKRVWSDLKTRVKKKASIIKTHRGRTGGGPTFTLSLKPLEERVLRLIGIRESPGGDHDAYETPIVPMSPKRVVSEKQLEILLGFVESHKDISLGRYPGSKGFNITREAWEEVAAKLNSVDDGMIKSPDQWRKYWIDLKATTISKASDPRRNMAVINQVPNRPPPLTEIEKRILKILKPVPKSTPQCAPRRAYKIVMRRINTEKAHPVAEEQQCEVTEQRCEITGKQYMTNTNEEQCTIVGDQNVTTEEWNKDTEQRNERRYLDSEEWLKDNEEQIEAVEKKIVITDEWHEANEQQPIATEEQHLDIKKQFAIIKDQPMGPEKQRVAPEEPYVVTKKQQEQYIIDEKLSAIAKERCEAAKERQVAVEERYAAADERRAAAEERRAAAEERRAAAEERRAAAEERRQIADRRYVVDEERHASALEAVVQLIREIRSDVSRINNR